MKMNLVLTTFGVGLVAAGLGSACTKQLAEDCEFMLKCVDYSSSSTGGGMGGTGGNGGGAGMGGDGGGGGVVGNCDPSMGEVEDGCGVFASSSLGVAGNDGSKGKPLASLAAAVAAAPEGGRVYACGEVFTEAVVVDKGVTIYGGLDCAGGGWNALSETRTTVQGAADVITLRVEAGANGAVIQDLEVRAADATVAGGSSIGVVVDGAQVEFVRCGITAGAGAKGSDGADGPAVAATAGPGGASGGVACSNAVQVNGAVATTNDCNGVFSVGGGGGDGTIANGTDGSNGLPAGALGQGGKGEVNAGWSCGVGGANGGANVGDNGAPGTSGLGAAAPGTLTAAGYGGTWGGAGTSGTPGQGGGGGGGAKGKVNCGGASGGAGGAGGCGGVPGEGGGPGGASFALVSIQASVTLSECTLGSGNGGVGGSGGDAQSGGSGGAGGTGGDNNNDASLKNACSGGDGGQGGSGGPGGGGLGGASAAIAHVGAPPEQSGTTTLKFGTGGLGGPGGNGNAQGNAGADGVGQEVMGF